MAAVVYTRAAILYVENLLVPMSYRSARYFG